VRPIREYDTVRVAKLLIPSRKFTGTEAIARAPRVGDIAVVCHEYAPNDPTATVGVEMVNTDGYTIWFADFEREELELVDAENSDG
jgi:hypothetical protein